MNFTSTVFIEHEDFRAVDDPTFYGLAPGKTVRLLFGYNITCIGLQKDAAGAIVSLEATYDLDSLGSKPPKGTLHWAGSDFIPGEVRVYDKLFSVEVPGKRLMLVVHQKALLEPLILDVAGAALTSRFQLQRLGYFTIDKDSNVQKPVLNRIVTLKESKELVALKNTDSKQFR